MKRQIEKHSEPSMRFFTPDLYLRFNSPNDQVADEANGAWEEAVAKYHEHLDRMRKKMPASVQRLADLCLHDAEIAAMDEELGVVPSADAVTASPCPPVFRLGALSLRQETQAISVLYVLVDDIQEYAAPESWPFSTERTHLLYDEIDGDQPLGFVHRLLLSDGRVLAITFSIAFAYCFDLQAKPVAG